MCQSTEALEDVLHRRLVQVAESIDCMALNNAAEMTPKRLAQAIYVSLFVEDEVTAPEVASNYAIKCAKAFEDAWKASRD